MTDIRVDYGVVASAQNDIDTGSRNISNQLDDMENQLKPLVEQWTGEAANSYQVAKANWNSALTDMSQVLQQIKGLLGESASNFNQTDRSGAARFGG